MRVCHDLVGRARLHEVAGLPEIEDQNLSVIQLEREEFPDPVDAVDLGPLEHVLELFASSMTTDDLHRVGPGPDLDILDPPGDDLFLEIAAKNLYLRKLWHRQPPLRTSPMLRGPRSVRP